LWTSICIASSATRKDKQDFDVSPWKNLCGRPCSLSISKYVPRLRVNFFWWDKIYKAILSLQNFTFWNLFFHWSLLLYQIYCELPGYQKTTLLRFLRMQLFSEVSASDSCFSDSTPRAELSFFINALNLNLDCFISKNWQVFHLCYVGRPAVFSCMQLYLIWTFCKCSTNGNFRILQLWKHLHLGKMFHAVCFLQLRLREKLRIWELVLTTDFETPCRNLITILSSLWELRKQLPCGDFCFFLIFLAN